MFPYYLMSKRIYRRPQGAVGIKKYICVRVKNLDKIWRETLWVYKNKDILWFSHETLLNVGTLLEIFQRKPQKPRIKYDNWIRECQSSTKKQTWIFQSRLDLIQKAFRGTNKSRISFTTHIARKSWAITLV